MKIAVLDDWTQNAASSADWSRLTPDHQVEIFSDHLVGEALIERLKPYDIIGIMRERSHLSEAVITQLPNLKAIFTPGMHNAAIDLEACRKRGILVSGSPTPAHATAELAMTLIGVLARNIVPNALSMQQGGWQIQAGRDLRGATLGVLGLGRLGSVVAKIGLAYGMDVVAWSQNLTPERAAEEGVRYLAKEQFFAQSDFISIHLKLSDRVRGLVGAAELAVMKKDACLVNTSRAPIIDGAALISALKKGEIGGAALDVYETEPLPADHPWRDVPNLVLTPHIGYVTHQTMDVFYGDMLNNIEAYLAGTPKGVLT